MTFSRFVEVGRVCMINYGDLEGKLCVIIDLVDHNKVLIDGPQSVTTIHRQMISIKRLMLTDIVVDITPEATTAELVTAMTAALPQWEATSYAKKRARSAARAETTDFDRFKIMIARKQKAKLLAK